MNVEIGTETPIFLFWQYLFRNFGVLSLQCRSPPTFQFHLCNIQCLSQHKYLKASSNSSGHHHYRETHNGDRDQRSGKTKPDQDLNAMYSTVF
jgi:hypothetical protein